VLPASLAPRIQVRQQKTGAVLSIPCHNELRTELESMPRVADTILVGERGAPLTGSSLSVMVRRQLREMGIDGYAIHGLRKNATIELINAGCTDNEAAAITGHLTPAMVAHYSKRRDQKLLARSAMDKLERAQSGKLKNGAA
jgi:integrase